MICQLSARSGNSVAELRQEPYSVLLTLADEVRERDEAWTRETDLLVGVFEMLQLIRREQLAGIGVKHRDLPPFHRVPRPGDPPPEPKTITPREAFALMIGGL